MTEFSVVGRDGLRAAGLSLPSVLQDIIALDRKLYLDDPHCIGTFEQWLPIFANFPHTWRALIKEKLVVGYWQTAPVKPAVFDALLKGQRRVSDLRATDYISINRPGHHSIYFVSVCLDENSRSVANQFALIASFIAVQADLLRRGIQFNRVAAHVHSREGRRLCEVLGLQGADQAGDKTRPLFTGSFAAAISRFRGQLAPKMPGVLSSEAAAA